MAFSKADLDEVFHGIKPTLEESKLPFDFKLYPGAVLVKVVHSLWAKVDTKSLTKKEQRDKFDALLLWFCKKNEYTLSKNIPQKYSFNGKVIDGRISYRISSPMFSCVVELTFDPDLAVANKMKHALLAKEYPIILKVGNHSTSAFDSICKGFIVVSL